jgi:RNA polymerase sigma-32 factor|tara:strand:+ start:465 stop:1316 length:852 start_codon:yes stop_codon:yes gene_type:complete
MGKSLQTLDILVPGSNLEAYIQTVNSIPVLSAQREKELSEKLYFDNDLDAARQLVLSHLRFVVYIAKSYSGYGLAEADLIQEGNVGLMKAVRRFNPEYGVRLVSFAVHWVKAEIHEFILRNWRIVKVATTKAQRKLFFNLRRAKKRLGWMNNREVDQVAKDLGLEAAVVRQMEERLGVSDEAYDGMEDTDDSPQVAPARYLEDSGSDPAKLVERQKTELSSLRGLRGALDGLDARSADIVAQRWLQDRKATLHQLAEKYGISAERVRQVEKNALKKMRVTLQA